MGRFDTTATVADALQVAFYETGVGGGSAVPAAVLAIVAYTLEQVAGACASNPVVYPGFLKCCPFSLVHAVLP